MYRDRRLSALVMSAILILFASSPVRAQAQDAHAGHQPPATSGAPPATREGSGTSWLPDESPMYSVHGRVGGWTLMGHGNLFVQYLHEAGDRGSEQTGSINWFMGMGRRPVGDGQLTLRGMVSLEPWTIGGCGYPDLLATGELCDGRAIRDRQHPHDLFMELTAQYDRPVGRGLRLQLYGGPVGEPALGPVAFMHRISGMPNPLAPMTHHWFDSTHITFGVATAGLASNRWKVEASAFNGREPDENRTDFDLDTMDSWSGRFWWLPSERWALQFSGGRLNEAEQGHDGEPPVDVERLTASITYHRPIADGSIWATTVGWGRNVEGDDTSHALIAETAVSLRDRDVVFGRAEWAQKSGHDLDVEEHDMFDVAKLQAGYTRYLAPWKGFAAGLGAMVSTGIVPRSLAPVYGRRFNPGVGVYLTVRPAAHRM